MTHVSKSAKFTLPPLDQIPEQLHGHAEAVQHAAALLEAARKRRHDATVKLRAEEDAFAAALRRGEPAPSPDRRPGLRVEIATADEEVGGRWGAARATWIDFCRAAAQLPREALDAPLDAAQRHDDAILAAIDAIEQARQDRHHALAARGWLAPLVLPFRGGSGAMTTVSTIGDYRPAPPSDTEVVLRDGPIRTKVSIDQAIRAIREDARRTASMRAAQPAAADERERSHDTDANTQKSAVQRTSKTKIKGFESQVVSQHV